MTHRIPRENLAESNPGPRSSYTLQLLTFPAHENSGYSGSLFRIIKASRGTSAMHDSPAVGSKGRDLEFVIAYTGDFYLRL